jgi:hypothetical protein
MPDTSLTRRYGTTQSYSAHARLTSHPDRRFVQRVSLHGIERCEVTDQTAERGLSPDAGLKPSFEYEKNASNTGASTFALT